MSGRRRLLWACALGALVATSAFGSAGCEGAPKPQPVAPIGGPQLPPGQIPGVAPGVQVTLPSAPVTAAEANMSSEAVAVYNQGLLAFANGDLTAAQAAFAQTTQLAPTSPQAFYSLGVVEERLGQSAAGDSYQKASSLQADYAPAIVAYGLWLAKHDKLEQADSFLTERRGRVQKPLEVAAAIAGALAEVKSLKGDSGSAQQIAQEALKLDSKHVPAMLTIARDHYRQHHFKLARLALDAILTGLPGNPARAPDDPEALLLRGTIYEETGYRGDAMADFEKAKNLRPDLITAKLSYATSLLESGDAKKALPDFLDAKKREPENLAARLGLGDCYRLLGQAAEAKGEFDWVVAREPDLPQVHYNLALLYLFSPVIPGMDQKQAVNAAIKELEKYDSLKKKGGTDDSAELMKNAKLRKAEIDAAEQAAAAPPPPPATAAPDAGAAPADGAGGTAPAGEGG
ncbi:MAG: tetratricopeptide repeat protein [Polyangiaceae bacterium]|nr:tetratricopeptide repeat protein [Polyangiaceae bacterium]